MNPPLPFRLMRHPSAESRLRDDIFLRHFTPIVSAVKDSSRRGQKMICWKLMTKKFLIGAVLGTMLSAVIISGCAVDKGPEDSRDSDRATVSQGISEREGGDSGGEHGSRGEGEESGGSR